jgi:uncharacterized protein (TIGR02246 family)
MLLAGAAHAADGGEAKAKPAAATPDARAEDRAAVRKTLDSLAKTFESRDAKALAAHFTEEGEFQNVQGVKLRGRETMEQAFAEFFAKTPEVTAQVRSASLRFLSTDSAIDEGAVTVQRGPANPAATARYSALAVREGGSWLLASLSESPLEDQTSIADLGWLIGKWKSAGAGGVEIETAYAWDPGKKFITMRFTRKEPELAVSGTQVIGLDPATGMIHSWTFEATGGIGEADWSRDGDHWVLDAAGTLADGRTLTETNVLRRVNDDTFTWQSIDRTLDDVELADLPPTKITRIKTEK